MKVDENSENGGEDCDDSSKLVSNSQVIGCEDRLRNDIIYCVGWGVKLYSIR